MLNVEMKNVPTLEFIFIFAILFTLFPALLIGIVIDLEFEELARTMILVVGSFLLFVAIILWYQISVIYTNLRTYAKSLEEWKSLHRSNSSGRIAPNNTPQTPSSGIQHFVTPPSVHRNTSASRNKHIERGKIESPRIVQTHLHVPIPVPTRWTPQLVAHQDDDESNDEKELEPPSAPSTGRGEINGKREKSEAAGLSIGNKAITSNGSEHSPLTATVHPSVTFVHPSESIIIPLPTLAS